MQIKNLYKEGKTIREIAEMEGVSPATIYNRLKKDGVNTKYRNTKNIPIDKILQLHNEGLSNRKIGLQLGFSHTAVSDIINNTDLQLQLKMWLNSEGFSFKQNKNILMDENKKYVIHLINFSDLPTRLFCRKFVKHFNEKGYKTLIIYEDEWIERKPQVKDFILAKLGKFREKIFARKCILATIDKKSAISFINDSHIQKISHGKNHIGLIYNDELVGLVQLRIHHRNSKDITISRMCFKRGVQIVGGFSRLVKAAIKWCQENGYGKLITWSDNRLTSGESYITAGFILDAKLIADNSFIKDKKRRSKQSMKKSNIDCPEGKSGMEWATELGYFGLWDAGKKRFIKQIDPVEDLFT